MKEETLREFKKSMDAVDWTKGLNAVLVDHNEQPIDPGLLIGWFANAIMFGYDEGIKKNTRPKDLVPAVSENRLRKIIKFQVEGRGGKVNPKDDFKGFIDDVKSCIHFGTNPVNKPGIKEGWEKRLELGGIVPSGFINSVNSFIRSETHPVEPIQWPEEKELKAIPSAWALGVNYGINLCKAADKARGGKL